MADRRRTRVWAAMMIVAVLAGLQAPAGAQARPVLAGQWRFNAERSDQPGEWAAQTGGGGYGRGLPPGAGRNGGIPSGGRMEPAPDPTVLLGLLRPVLQIQIRQTDSTVDISDATGQFVTYRTDGRKIREPQLVGDDVEIVARWKDGQLQIERKLPSIGTVKETYWLDRATGSLVLQVKLSGSRLPRGIEMRRVYDSAPEGS
jgi:hypothetical protein